MFGVVPKPLWSKATPADDANRIQLNTNCIVIRNGSEIVLIDSGYGTKCSETELEHMAADQPTDLLAGLQAHGISAADVTWVIPSHLHFDHAGGLTVFDESGILRPTFPNAKHFVQRAEWEDGLGNRPELAGNYPTNELRAIEDAGLFETCDGNVDPLPFIRVEQTGGHTRGHQTITVHDGEREAIYLGDVCPTAAHLKTFWTMAYDQFPLDVRKLKPKLLDRAIEREQLILFDHDPDQVGARLSKDERGRYAIVESIPAAQL